MIRTGDSESIFCAAIRLNLFSLSVPKTLRFWTRRNAAIFVRAAKNRSDFSALVSAIFSFFLLQFLRQNLRFELCDLKTRDFSAIAIVLGR